MEEKYIAKGEMSFCAFNVGLKSVFESIEEIGRKTTGEVLEGYSDFLIKHYYTFDIYDLLSGEDFLEMVDSGYITDNDGILAEVFVDGYKSNLGLYCKGFRQGNFLVDKEIWLGICKKHKIEVNWANK